MNSSLLHHSCPLHTSLSSKLTASPQSSSFLGPSLPQLGPHIIITRFTQPLSVPGLIMPTLQPVPSTYQRGSSQAPQRLLTLGEFGPSISSQPYITAPQMLSTLNRARTWPEQHQCGVGMCSLPRKSVQDCGTSKVQDSPTCTLSLPRSPC